MAWLLVLDCWILSRPALCLAVGRFLSFALHLVRHWHRLGNGAHWARVPVASRLLCVLDIPNRGEKHGAPGSRVATGGPGHVGGASVSLCEGAADCVRHYYGVCTITYPIFQLSGTTGRPAAIRWLARCYDPHRVRAMSRDNDHHEVNHMLVGLCVEVDGVLGTMLLLPCLPSFSEIVQRRSAEMLDSVALTSHEPFMMR